MRGKKARDEMQGYPPPRAQGERCGHPDCKGYTGTHPEFLTLRGGRILKAEFKFTLGAAPGKLSA